MPTPSPFYPLIPSPPSPSGGGSGGGATTSTPASAFKAFLGYGLLAPLRRDRKQDFANAGGIDLIRSAVAQIISTRCAGDVSGSVDQGELEWRPEFGTLLHRLAHRKGVVLQELGRVWIVGALQLWEPRVVVTETDITFDRAARVLTIRIRYNVIDQNVAGNNVIANDIEQSIDLPLAA